MTGSTIEISKVGTSVVVKISENLDYDGLSIDNLPTIKRSPCGHTVEFQLE